MGRGRSGLAGGGGGKAAASPKANTPSGISYDQFMKMSDAQKMQTINNILADPNIKVPAYLDNSDTSKFMWAMGMNNKPNVVSDDQLSKMPGKDLYRTVYDTQNPPPSGTDILDQIRTGDFTQMSGSGGSAHGRALYFARDDFAGSASYGVRGNNPVMARAKINSNANIVKESDLRRRMVADGFSTNSSSSYNDDIALYALSHGIDGWYSGTYTMMVNRGALTISNKTKRAGAYQKTAAGRIKTKNRKPVLNIWTTWDQAADL